MIRFRSMLSADLDAVVEIEQAVTPHPWTRAQFQQSIANSHHCWVAEVQQQLIGYYLYSTVIDEASVLNLAVKPDQQGKGFGRALLSDCLHRSATTAKTLFLEVRTDNVAAIALYLSAGFNQLGERRNYYRTANSVADALIMAKELCVADPD